MGANKDRADIAIARVFDDCTTRAARLLAVWNEFDAIARIVELASPLEHGQPCLLQIRIVSVYPAVPTNFYYVQGHQVDAFDGGV